MSTNSIACRPVCGLAAVVLIGTFILSGAMRAGGPAAPGPELRAERIQSVTLSSRRAPSHETLTKLRSVGSTHVTLVPFAFQRGVTSTDIRFNPDARWYTESDTGIRVLADSIHALGMQVILKPHVWVSRTSEGGAWRSDIGFDTEREWQTWESGYRRYIMHHARLASAIAADAFVVGTELRRAAVDREAFWRSLIADVREIFPGKVTYAANWWEEYTEVRFWDALDFIGVQAYFPLGDRDDATVDELSRGWQPHIAELTGVADEFRRPVLFTEIGYRSFTGATERPWEWPSREQARTGSPNNDVQTNLYEAFFQTVWDNEWFAGAILWRWYAEESSDGPTQRIGFTPQNKPAEETIRRWFVRGTD